MSAIARIYVEDPATQAGTYTHIRLWRDSTPGGAFATLAGSTALVSTTYSYTITDSAATSTTYWRYTLYNSTTLVESSLSEVWQPDGLTFKKLIFEVARLCGAGFSGTASAAGSATTLVDVRAVDDGVDSLFQEGGWLWRPDTGDTQSRVRRITQEGFSPSSGTYSINANNPWGVPGSGEEYGVFNFFPPVRYGTQPYSWADAVNEGLRACWYIDRVFLTTGTTTGQRRFSLATHLRQVSRDDIRAVYLRTVDANSIVTEVSQNRSGHWWNIIEDGPQALTLDMWPAPGESETIVVEYNRRYSPLYNETDVTLCPQELAAKAGAWKAMARLNRLQAGKYEVEEKLARQEWVTEYMDRKPTAVIVG